MVAPWIESNVDEPQLISYLTERKKASRWEIDGIIITDDAIHERNTSKNPKYAVAFKMITDIIVQVVATEVIRVEWNIGGDGYMSPVICINPVFIDATIQRVSGKNAKFIVDNCIGPGSIIKVAKDGDVIPGVYAVISPSRNGVADLPNDVDYHWTPTNVNIILDEIETNSEVQLQRAVRFFEKMGVVGFAEGMITRCFTHPKLNTITKILEASVHDFMELPGVQLKLGTKIYEAIRTAMGNPDLYQVMAASSTFGRGFGFRKIKALLAVIPGIVDRIDFDQDDISINAQMKNLIGDICKINGFDIKTATQFVSRIKKFKEFLTILPANIIANIIYPSISSMPISGTSGLSTSVPSTSVSSTSVSSTSVPSTSVPSTSVPSTSVPSTSVSSASVPSTSISFKSTNELLDSDSNEGIENESTTRFTGQTVVFSGFRNKVYEKIIDREGGNVGASVSSKTTIVVVKAATLITGKVAKAQNLGVTIMTLDEFQQQFNM